MPVMLALDEAWMRAMQLPIAVLPSMPPMCWNFHCPEMVAQMYLFGALKEEKIVTHHIE
jgi:hypothetical protein